MRKIVACVVLALLTMSGIGRAQYKTVKGGVEDMKWKVGTFSRQSRLSGTGTVALHGMTPVNVLAYGVDNTGATDCADSLQAVIDSVGAWGGGAVYMPAGRYKIGTTIYIRNDNIMLFGDGMNATVVFPDTTNHPNGIIMQDVSNCTVRDLCVRGIVYSGSPERTGIAADGGSFCTITHCLVDSCDDSGIRIGYDQIAYAALDSADRYDLSKVDDSYGHRVIGNIIRNTHGGSGIELMRADSCVVANNVIINSWQHGIRVDAAMRASIVGNVVSRAGSAGIKVQGYGEYAVDDTLLKKAENVVISGNTVYAYYPIYVSGDAKYITISGNDLDATYLFDSGDHAAVILDDQYNDKCVIDYRHVIVTDNVMRGGRFGMLVRGNCRDVIIRDNIINEYAYIGLYLDTNDTSEKMVGVDIDGNVFRKTSLDPSYSVTDCIRFDGPNIYAHIGRNTFDMWDYTNVRPIIFLAGGLSSSASSVSIDPLDITAFGARGDGTTDDTAAIQAAIDACEAAGGGEVYFPEGDYKITSQVAVADSVTMRGSGRHSSRLLHMFNGDMMTLGTASGLYDLALIGNGDTYTGKGIVINDGYSLQRVQNCKITGFDDACIYFSVNGGSQSSFTNLEVWRYNSGTGTDRYAIVIDPTQQLSAKPRKFSHIETGGNCAFDFGGCNNVYVSDSFLADLKFGAESRGVHITTTRIANQDTLVINGDNNTIVDCNISPAVKIAYSVGSCVIGPNSFNKLPVDDNSNQQSNMIYHRGVDYTPTITTSGTAPSLGDGTIRGRWSIQGDMVHVTIELTLGSTTSLGTSQLRFSLPEEAPNVMDTVQQCGSFVGISGGTYYTGVCQIPGATNYVTIVRDTSGYVTSSSPVTWAAGDILRLSFVYRK